MMKTDDSTILASFAAYNATPRNDTARFEFAHKEQALRNALERIVADATRLLADLNDPARAPQAVHDITMMPGASGPIGSQWEKATAAATVLQTMFRWSLNYGDSGDAGEDQ